VLYLISDQERSLCNNKKSPAEQLEDGPVAKKKEIVIEDNECPGFSERFNELLTKIDFADGSARVNRIETTMGVSLSTARNWVVNDKPPAVKTLRDIIHKLQPVIETAGIKATGDDICGWLLFNVGDPLDKGIEEKLDQLARKLMAFDIQLMGAIYVIVHEQANAANIDIYTDYAGDAIDKVYARIANYVLKNEIKAVDIFSGKIPELPELVKNLLFVMAKGAL